MTLEAQADHIHLGAAEAADANDGLIGEGTPETAPGHDPAAALSVTERQPVRIVGLVQGVLVGALAVALGARKAALPLAAGMYLLDDLAARRVTPLARPRDCDGDPLTPAPAPDLSSHDYDHQLAQA